jgi:uncharacterized radical SAM superfamily protein
MLPFSVESLWRLNQQELADLLDSKVFTQKNHKIHFYAPSFTYYKNDPDLFCFPSQSFPTISITGTSCALNCKHCGNKVLATMQPAITPEALFDACSKFKQSGVAGCLISGGCLPDGSVPLKPFTATIARIKRELGLTVFVHTGIIDLETATLLKHSGVDAALIDVIGSQEIINKIYELKVTVNDYAKSLEALQRAGLSFVPHVIVGLNEGKLDGELVALRMISQVRPSAVVVLAFMPLHGTKMASVEPSCPYDVARVLVSARVMFPKTPIVLGCMRPKGKLRITTDVLALKSGVDAIAFPSLQAVAFAKTQNWHIFSSPYCCAKIFADLNNDNVP